MADVADPPVESPPVVEGRLVEALGERGAPVDHQLLAAGVDAVEPDAPHMLVVDATEHDQLVLELIHRPAHDRRDVLLAQRVGPLDRETAEPFELGIDRIAGARQRGAFEGQVDRRRRGGGGVGVG